MEKQQIISVFMMNNSKYFKPSHIPVVLSKLEGLNESQLLSVSSLDFQNPTMVFILSFFAGGLGIDRFLIGDIGMGFLKLFTAGLCGILYFIDLFIIMGATRDRNFDKLMRTYY